MVDRALTFEMKTLTPIWTGDTDRNSAVVQESGILGSLRFWYEGILRGAGVFACDPIDNPCPKDEPCGSCQLFGSTRHARAFRFEVDGLQPIPLSLRFGNGSNPQTREWLHKTFAWDTDTRTIRGGRRMLWAQLFNMRAVVSARVRQPDFVTPLLAYTVLTAATEGGIGAKTQNGFGQVKLLQIDGAAANAEAVRSHGDDLIRAMPQATGEQRERNESPALFSLTPGRFFSFEWEVSAPFRPNTSIFVPEEATALRHLCIPCAFEIRYKDGAGTGLRPALSAQLGPEKAKAALGGTGSASRVHVSHLFRETQAQPYHLKVWGDVAHAEVVMQAVIALFPQARLIRQFRPDVLPEADGD